MHLVMTTYSNFLAFYTFLSRQTNLFSTSCVLSVKQCQYEQILDETQKRKCIKKFSLNFAYTCIAVNIAALLKNIGNLILC